MKKLINILVKDLFNTITEEDILSVKQGSLYYKNKALSDEVTNKLVEDAKNFSESTLWLLLTNELKYRANKTIFEKSVSADDILAGKILLYLVDIIKKRLKTLSKFRSME